ncbi:TPA: hypothetical protein ACKP9S_003582 [Pseudomonas aeruginosa]
MQNRIEQQRHRAAVFVAANQERVATVTGAAANMANVFLGRLASKVLLRNTLTNLQSLAQPATIEAFALHLRQHASEFGRAGVTSSYWELIDGIFSLADATGAQWPYMTEEVRAVRLKHAAEHLEDCERILEADVSKLCA